MEKFKLTFLILLFLCLPKSLFAQSNPVPVTETPFTQWDEAGFEAVRSIIKPDEKLIGAKLSFDVMITNQYSRDITCKNTQFNAHMGVYGERCERADYRTSIGISNGNNSVEIKANQTVSWKVGNTERESRGKLLGKDLEFCGRDIWDLDCGFNCSNGKKFNETLDEAIDGGYRRFKCEANGEMKRTSDPVYCSEGYSPDIANDRCIKLCEGGHLHGDNWSWEIAHGRIEAYCRTDGSTSKTTVCVDQGYQASGLECIPASCGGNTPHGGTAVIEYISFGKKVGVCSFGQFIEIRAECDPGAVNEVSYCRQPNSCGDLKHGERRTHVTRGCSHACSTGFQEARIDHCEDGNISSRMVEGECKLSRYVTCSPGPHGRPQ